MNLCRSNLSKMVLVLAAFTIMISAAQAQSSATATGRGPTIGYRFSYTPIHQFETDLDGGGSFDVQRHFFRFDISRFIDRHWMVGIGLSLDYERWSFSDVPGLAGIDPWDEILRPGISVPVFYRTGKWQLGVIPSVDVAGATGAQIGESLSYGAVLSAGYAFGPDLIAGLGVGLFNRLGQTEAFPYLVIDWTLNDRLRLTNPFRAGPVGPAGLELVYSPNDTLEMGLGGAYRSYRFRLDDSSVVADGIGEVDFWAPFLRIGWRLGRSIHLDLNGGALFGGSIAIEDENGNLLGETDYDTAPFAGLTLRGSF